MWTSRSSTRPSARSYTWVREINPQYQQRPGSEYIKSSHVKEDFEDTGGFTQSNGFTQSKPGQPQSLFLSLFPHYLLFIKDYHFSYLFLTWKSIVSLLLRQRNRKSVCYCLHSLSCEEHKNITQKRDIIGFSPKHRTRTINNILKEVQLLKYQQIMKILFKKLIYDICFSAVLYSN